MQIKPKLFGTNTWLHPSEWHPESFETFLEELEYIVDQGMKFDHLLLFRGQADYRWLLDSTFVRWIKENVLGISTLGKLKPDYQSSMQANLLLGELLLYKFGELTAPSEDIFNVANQNPDIDPWFEWMKRIQQYPAEDLGPILGSFLLDWTQNWKVATYFANENRQPEATGAVFIADITAMGSILHRDKRVGEILQLFEKAIYNERAAGCPLIFYPRAQILQQRAKNQDAIYIAQVVLRYDLTELWVKMMENNEEDLLFIKLALPAGTSEECSKWLASQGMTKQFLFPVD